jgi:hypothetical protein
VVRDFVGSRMRSEGCGDGGCMPVWCGAESSADGVASDAERRGRQASFV